VKFLETSALLLAFFALPLLARANGVERGDISIHANESVPNGVEDRLESLMFANCDLRGALKITTSSVDVGRDDPSQYVYHIQYNVEFRDDRLVLIDVEAALHFDGGPETSVEVRSFRSPICRSYP
jgi:hypothetical protein